MRDLLNLSLLFTCLHDTTWRLSAMREYDDDDNGDDDIDSVGVLFLID